MKILAVENDPSFVQLIKDMVESEHYAVTAAYNATVAKELLQTMIFDLILLDIKMPEENGFEVCRWLRQENINTPVIMMSGFQKDEQDVIEGLNCGADDYLLKPFTPGILVAKIHTVLRRYHANIDSTLRAGRLVLDQSTRQIQCGAKYIPLTGHEYDMLECLMRNAGHIVSRHILEGHICSQTREIGSNVVDAYVSRLRSKLNKAGDGSILSVKGLGYMFKPGSFQASEVPAIRVS